MINFAYLHFLVKQKGRINVEKKTIALWVKEKLSTIKSVNLQKAIQYLVSSQYHKTLSNFFSGVHRKEQEHWCAMLLAFTHLWAYTLLLILFP